MMKLVHVSHCILDMHTAICSERVVKDELFGAGLHCRAVGSCVGAGSRKGRHSHSR